MPLKEIREYLQDKVDKQYWIDPYTRKEILEKLYKQAKFDFRNYPQMPKEVQEDMEKIERDVDTGRE